MAKGFVRDPVLNYRDEDQMIFRGPCEVVLGELSDGIRRARPLNQALYSFWMNKKFVEKGINEIISLEIIL